MDINKILSADILDIIFDGKNKQYGAYDLRKTYNKRLTKALLFTAALAALIFFASLLYAKVFNKTGSEQLDVLDTQLAEIKKETPPPPTFHQLLKAPARAAGQLAARQ